MNAVICCRIIFLFIILVPAKALLQSPFPFRVTLLFTIHVKILTTMSPRVCNPRIESGHADMHAVLNLHPVSQTRIWSSVDENQRTAPSTPEPLFVKKRHLWHTTAAHTSRSNIAASSLFWPSHMIHSPAADAPRALCLRGGEAMTNRQVGRIIASGGFPPRLMSDAFTQNYALIATGFVPNSEGEGTAAGPPV